MIGTLLVVVSCQKETEEEAIVEAVEQRDARAGFRERYFIYMSWDGHRPRSECKTGFGICNVYTCFNCCIVSGDRVPCDEDPDALAVDNAGVITDVDGSLALIFKLNPSNAEHQNAINNQSIFYVDNDFFFEGHIIKEGEYDYDATVGAHGGYLINVEEE